jgi:hypothetical protein
MQCFFFNLNTKGLNICDVWTLYTMWFLLQDIHFLNLKKHSLMVSYVKFVELADEWYLVLKVKGKRKKNILELSVK